MDIQAITALTAPAPATGEVAAGPGLSLTDLGRFDHAIYTAQSQLDTVAVTQVAPVERAVLTPLDGIDASMKHLEETARAAVERGGDLSPADTVLLMAQAHRFAFETQLVASVANKTSDGVSQLFRQQS